MAGISSSIQLADQMTPVLQSITAAMNIMVSSFNIAQTAADTSFNPAQAMAMQQAVINASAELAQYQENLERVQNTPVKPPEPPTWNAMPNQPVFMSSGAERFEQEYRAANSAAQQLYKQQQAISAQARAMKVVPPGMMNDMAATSNRVQSLSLRVQELNNIPVNLRTERTNNELESMRQKLLQVSSVQEELSDAMSRMDISAANAAYQQLNTVMDSAERNIRDNLTAQEQFNQSIQAGTTKAGGLEGTIKRYAAVLLSAATAGKAISLADEVTQTTTRLDLMNQQFEENGDLQQKIYESAQRSRGVYQTTADAVSKLGMQARDAFANTDEVVAFAEQLNKTFVVAGTSAQGVDSVMLQLTQAMAAGKLQGEELNAVLDNAQPIVQNIADYMGVPVGQIKKLASEGAISAEIIKNAMFAAADETNAKFMQMPMTFGQVANSIKNQALMAFQPALQQLSAVTQTAGFQSLVNGVLSGIQMLSAGAVQALELLGQAAMFVQENLWWLIPVIGGVAAAMIAYKGAVLAYNIVQGISNGLKILSVLNSVAHGAAITAEMTATTGLTAAQLSFNASLLACPLTWIVIGIVAAIAAIYAGVAAFNKFTGASVSATGVVAAVFGVLAAHIYNNFVVPTWNVIAAFINFFYNVWNDPIAAVKVLFYDLASTVIGYVVNMAQAIEDVINSIPGVEVSITAGLKGFQGQIESAAAKAKSESDWKEIVSTKEFMDYSTAASKAYEWGANKESQIKNVFNGSEKVFQPDYGTQTMMGGMSDSLGKTAGNTGSTAADTAAIADQLDIVEEDLKYMRDAAEQEVINRFTLAELKIDVNNHNTLKTKTDFDDVNRMLGAATSEILAAAAEGGHI